MKQSMTRQGFCIVGAGLILTSWMSSLAFAADTGAASEQLYNRPDAKQKIESMETMQRVRIPVILQAWSNITAKSRDGGKQDSRIAQKPVSHVLRARIEKTNDFYVGDWRIQTTPIRWIKATGQYQVRLELYRRYGEGGQIEENLGSVNLTGLLQKQADGLYLVHGSAKRRFTDSSGQPVASLQIGDQEEPVQTEVSKANVANPALR